VFTTLTRQQWSGSDGHGNAKRMKATRQIGQKVDNDSINMNDFRAENYISKARIRVGDLHFL
jgi:hypothetical protein